MSPKTGKADLIEMQFDGEEITTNLTTKVSNNLHKVSNKLGIHTQGLSQVVEEETFSKIDLEAAKKHNAELMSFLVGKKMSKNKTFYEIKVLTQNQLGAMGHLHGISAAGLASNMPTGHFTA